MNKLTAITNEEGGLSQTPLICETEPCEMLYNKRGLMECSQQHA